MGEKALMFKLFSEKLLVNKLRGNEEFFKPKDQNNTLRKMMEETLCIDLKA